MSAIEYDTTRCNSCGVPSQKYLCDTCITNMRKSTGGIVDEAAEQRRRAECFGAAEEGGQRMNRMTEAEKEAGYLAFESIKEQHRIYFEELDRVQAAEQRRRAECFEELVAALEAVTICLGRYCQEDDQPPDSAKKALRDSRAVLAKAKGGEGR